MKKILILVLIVLFTSNIFAKEKVIAKIPEASGISYSYKSNTLFIVNDEGSIYEISLEGQILREKKIGKLDLEGIAVDDENDLLLLAVEGDDEILVLSKNKLKKKHKISIKRDYKGVKVLKKGDDGLEGIALYKNKIYLSNQSKNKYPKDDSSVVVIVDYDLKKKKQKIENIINHGFIDIAGLTFYNDILFMISDKENLLIQYDIKRKKAIKKEKLSKKYAQEGITFDKNGNLYIADDNGQILKIDNYKK
ncbi:MAG: SdiA-regulated domain-containing protein [Halarcobacter sp.]